MEKSKQPTQPQDNNKTEPTRKQLVEAAKDINVVLRLYPPIGGAQDLDIADLAELNNGDKEDHINEHIQRANIDVKKMGVEELKKAIVDNSTEITTMDPLSKETWIVLDSVGVSIQKSTTKAIPQTTKKEKEGKTMGANGNKGKSKGKKEGTKPAAVAATKVGKRSANGIVRDFSVVDAIVAISKGKKSPPSLTMAIIAEEANSLYTKAGGANNLTNSMRAVKLCIRPLVRCGFIEKNEDGTYRLSK